MSLLTNSLKILTIRVLTAHYYLIKGFFFSMYRTHTCDDLRPEHVGQTVTLSGWVHSRRDHGGVIFIDLRDMYGLTQVTFNPDNGKEALELAEKLRSEFVIKVTGEVAARPDNMVNDKLDTGQVELMVKEVEILGPCKTLPFEIDSDQEVNEETRLQYRFLDLRRERMRENLLFRGKVIKFLRDWCYSKGFTEFETPILTASSPEGARDFLVPSRIHPGKFYALPQAPQQYKQMLMMSGFDKYFQIAPCFRDEDPRADRSPGEFYQLDMETSFLSQDEFFDLVEPMFIEMTEKFGGGRKVKNDPFPRIPFREAMLKYGSDKPDLRFDMEIQDVTELVKGCGFKVFAGAADAGGVVRCLVAEGAAEFPRSTIDELTTFAQGHGAKGLAYIVLEKDGNIKSPILKFLGDDLTKQLIETVGAKPGDTIFFGADAENSVATVLGQVRNWLGKNLQLIDETVIAWAWIVDFPMFEYDEKEKKVDFGHNPFSMPQGGLEGLDAKDPLDVLAYQYDIVANGLELSSGAVRNYSRDIMYKAFGIAGYSPEEVDKEFSGMINAFDYGAPPTCGFAPGVERMIMLLANEPNIREITAFPKNGKAQDLLMGAPSDVKPEQLKELSIKLDVKK
jgi:aspartyl-tRNA synthetase